MRTEAFGIGGLGGHFTLKGIKTIESIIDHIGPEIDMHSRLHGAWEKIARDIISRAQKWGKPDLVVIGGHSWGCKVSVHIADRLNSHGISIDYMFGIDPTLLPRGAAPMVMPDNVKYVDEFHATQGIVQRGRKWNQGGKFIYPRKWNGTKELVIVPGGHVPCAKNPITQNKIKNRVESLLNETR